MYSQFFFDLNFLLCNTETSTERIIRNLIIDTILYKKDGVFEQADIHGLLLEDDCNSYIKGHGLLDGEDSLTGLDGTLILSNNALFKNKESKKSCRIRGVADSVVTFPRPIYV